MNPLERYREFVTRTSTIHDLLADRAAAHADDTFLRFRGERHSFGEVDKQVRRLAKGLQAAGVEEGDHIAIVLPTGPDFVFTWFASSALGCVPVPINVAYRTDESRFRYLLRHSDSSGVVIDGDYLSAYRAVSSALPAEQTVVVRDPQDGPRQGGDDRPAPVPMADLLDCEPLSTTSAADPSDVAMLIYTSGTTGRPKGCLIPHGQFLYNAFGLVDGFDYRATDVHYEPLPLFHIRGAMDLVAALMSGGQFILEDAFDVETAWTATRQVGATVFHSIGAVMARLYDMPPDPADADNPVRLFVTGPRIEDTAGFEDRFDLTALELYGQTETPATLTPLKAVSAGDIPVTSAGRPAPWVSMKIVDPDGFEVDPGEVGEVLVRSEEPAAMFRGYYGDPELTVEAWQDLWFHTGDFGRMDDRGCFHFVDRGDDIIRKNGENIASAEIEDRLLKHPAVAEVTAIPVPSDRGDDIHVAVTTNEDGGFDYEAFFDWCQTRLPSLWLPDSVDVRKSLPKTETDRIKKAELRQEGVPDTAWRRDG